MSRAAVQSVDDIVVERWSVVAAAATAAASDGDDLDNSGGKWTLFLVAVVPDI